MPEPLPTPFVANIPGDRETLLQKVAESRRLRANLRVAGCNPCELLPEFHQGKHAVIQVTRSQPGYIVRVDGITKADATERIRLLKLKNAPSGFHRWN
jgi:hypothetical protein